MDLVEIFEKILSIKYPHELIYYSLYYYGLHFSFKKGIDPLLERAIKWVKNKPPILEREKEKMTLYASFCDTLIDKLKDPPDDNPFNTKGFNTDRHISVLPNFIESIFQENKEYKNLDRQVCLNLAISVLDIFWNNTPDEDQASIEKALTPFKEELQKTFQDAQKEILKILRHWEDQDYLPPKLVYVSHFNSVEARREEELKRLEYYVPLELEVKLSQKGGGEPGEARSVLLDCLDKKRNAIIIGESGSGKTFTFLKLFGELKERYFNDEISFIPLFIELYKFNPPHEHVNLETLLQQYLVIDVNRFHRDKEKYILFLDGLNESPNPEEAFKEIKASQGMQIFLSTQREETFFEDKAFSTYYMLPLGEEEVIQYLSYCPRLSDKEKTRTLYQKLDRVLKEQIKRPVFLFFISLLYEETGNIPTSLGVLLSSFTDFLCERKLAKSKIGIGTPFDSTYKRKVLPYMAFSMCKENKRELKETELEKLFEDIIPNDPHDYDKFKKQVCKTYWLIRQSKKAESFEFTHELLRDYFAAVYIKNEGMAIDEVLRLVFTDGKPNTTFASVVQLLCGIESEEGVSHLISGILKKDPYLAAACFAMSTANDLPLFDKMVHQEIVWKGVEKGVEI
ncbi:MAG: hypothetical protein HZA47_09810 [Planctomycetes bacterium]|nr:hypothetical protein [Planctomycetota bacterium]